MVDTRRTEVLIVGAAGHGMAPISAYLTGINGHVYIHDRNMNSLAMKELMELGCTIVDDTIPTEVEMLIYSSSVPLSHHLIVQGRKLGVRILSRGDWIASLPKDRLIAVAGSHGKTSTAWFLVQILRLRGLRPSMIIGGRDSEGRVLGFAGSSTDPIVLEVDDTDGSILKSNAFQCILLNVEDDICLVDNQSTEDIFNAWLTKTEATRLYVPAATEFPKRIASTLASLGDKVMRVQVPPTKRRIPRHIAINIAVAAQCGEEIVSDEGNHLGVSLAEMIDSIDQPLSRNFETSLRSGLWHLYRDAADHPGEIKVVLSELRRLHPKRVIHVVQQVSRFSRAIKYREGYLSALSLADRVTVLPIDPKGERLEQDVDPEKIRSSLIPPNVVESMGFPLQENNEKVLIAVLGDGQAVDEWMQNFTRQYGALY